MKRLLIVAGLLGAALVIGARSLLADENRQKSADEARPTTAELATTKDLETRPQGKFILVDQMPAELRQIEEVPEHLPKMQFQSGPPPEIVESLIEYDRENPIPATSEEMIFERISEAPDFST